MKLDITSSDQKPVTNTTKFYCFIALTVRLNRYINILCGVFSNMQYKEDFLKLNYCMLAEECISSMMNVPYHHF